LNKQVVENVLGAQPLVGHPTKIIAQPRSPPTGIDIPHYKVSDQGADYITEISVLSMSLCKPSQLRR